MVVNEADKGHVSSEHGSAVDALLSMVDDQFVDNYANFRVPMEGVLLILTANDLTKLPAHIVDRFYRIDPSRSSDTGGHGIGLSVAKAIVTAHGGRIQADTQTGCDFRITAIFPL